MGLNKIKGDLNDVASWEFQFKPPCRHWPGPIYNQPSLLNQHVLFSWGLHLLHRLERRRIVFWRSFPNVLLVGKMRRPAANSTINVNAMTRKIDVDNRIPLRNYYRIADNLLKQVFNSWCCRKKERFMLYNLVIHEGLRLQIFNGRDNMFCLWSSIKFIIKLKNFYTFCGNFDVLCAGWYISQWEEHHWPVYYTC